MHDLKQILVGCIDDIEHQMKLIWKDMHKAHLRTAAARRIRVISVNLEKLFKKYRKLSCKIGLK